MKTLPKTHYWIQNKVSCWFKLLSESPMSVVYGASILYGRERLLACDIEVNIRPKDSRRYLKKTLQWRLLMVAGMKISKNHEASKQIQKLEKKMRDQLLELSAL